METELHNFVFVWISVVTALIYCRYISNLVPVGTKSLFFFLPVILLFFLLPPRLTTMSLGNLTCFFVTWLCNLMLLLLARGKGPLAPPSQPLSLPIFVAVACLPIKIGPSTGSAASKNGGGNGLKSPANYVMKCLLEVSLVPFFLWSNYVHEKVMMMAYSVHMYITLELSLGSKRTRKKKKERRNFYRGSLQASHTLSLSLSLGQDSRTSSRENENWEWSSDVVGLGLDCGFPQGEGEADDGARGGPHGGSPLLRPEAPPGARDALRHLQGFPSATEAGWSRREAMVEREVSRFSGRYQTLILLFFGP